ncbi:hypothetical protein SBADM41S_11025 [Streptomyces badius]
MSMAVAGLLAGMALGFAGYFGGFGAFVLVAALGTADHGFIDRPPPAGQPYRPQEHRSERRLPLVVRVVREKAGSGPADADEDAVEPPETARAVSTRRWAALGSALSAASPSTSPPSSAAASSTDFSSRPVMITFAPSAASARAVALPRPRVAPVTM